MSSFTTVCRLTGHNICTNITQDTHTRRTPLAIDFLSNSRPFQALQEREKVKYSNVVQYLTRDYTLRRGDSVRVAQALECSPQTVMLIARVIHRVVSLYKQKQPTAEQTLERAALGDWEALKAISLYDHTLTWREVVQLKDDVTPIAPTIKTPVVAPLDERVEVMPAWMAGEHTMPHHAALPFAQGDTITTQEKRRQFVRSTNLPRRTVVSGRHTHVEYRPAFQKAYRRLSKHDADSVRSAINELATYGYRHTRESQKHRKLPLDRAWAPKGSYVSRVKLSLRYVWGYERSEDDSRWNLVVYYVGTHDKVWSSEK